MKRGAPAVTDAASSTAQLWPHVHGTDAMFLALFRKNNKGTGTTRGGSHSGDSY
ncbi:ribosomal RNA small subunit methyltransferase B [Rothia aeria]|uniref:Ribosomal RNA small subunit methyltransferase B n=1 Tax=Rothia aeria TaxID=172042 RepID=A0A2Z5R1L9_9MICC|nr:ribosomal RNA small subunit methyltransferase B [Rothia aeria]